MLHRNNRYDFNDDLDDPFHAWPGRRAANGTLLTNGSNNDVRDLFSGERWISEMLIYDLRNRFYSPDLGRFLQPDPIGFKGDASNLYRYCGNDWANRTDPMGTEYDFPSADLDRLSREGGIPKLQGIMRNSRDGLERATSTGIDRGKPFLSTNVEKGVKSTSARGAQIQDVNIPVARNYSASGVGGIGPATGIHVHTTNDLHDAQNKVVTKGGTLSTINDRAWTDKEGRTMYTGTVDGSRLERHVNWKADTAGERIKHGGITQVWDGKKWVTPAGGSSSGTSSNGSNYYVGTSSQPVQASSVDPGPSGMPPLGFMGVELGLPRPGPIQ